MYNPPNSPHVNQSYSPPNFDQPYSPSTSPHINQPHSPPNSPQQDSTSKIKSDDSPPPLKRRKHKQDPMRNQAAYKLMLSLREEKCARKRQSRKEDQDEIVTNDYACNVADPPPKQSWINSKLFTLSTSDKTIIDSGNWLTDDIIDAGQKILATQFKKRFGKAGFQSVILGRTFSFNVESEEFVQVLHDGINHWLLVSTVGTTPSSVMVYDSLYASAGQTTKRQVASIMRVTEPTLTMNFADVQMQAGGSDCGIFALAFATAICCGHSPGKFQFDQQCMRNHLIKCLEDQQFTMFPIKKEQRQARKIKSSETIPLYCVCRMPPIREIPMIQCSHCKQWYHGKNCIKTTDEAWLPGAKWFCSPSCFTSN